MIYKSIFKILHKLDFAQYKKLKKSRVYSIASINYCGSTLLNFTLGANSNCFATGEIHSLKREKQGQCSFHQQHCPFWTRKILDILHYNSNFYTRCKEYITQIVGPIIIIHSIKLPINHYNLLEENSTLDGLIILFKRPEAYYKSVSVHNKKRLQDSLNNYTRVYEKLLALKENNKISSIVIYYDDFATHPEKMLRKICPFLHIPFEKNMLEPWKVSDQFHTIGGNTGMYTHLWGRDEFDRIKTSDYWKDIYSEDHSKWIEENFQKIKLDEKWKTLPPDTLETIKKHEKSREMFNKLMAMRQKI